MPTARGAATVQVPTGATTEVAAQAQANDQIGAQVGAQVQPGVQNQVQAQAPTGPATDGASVTVPVQDATTAPAGARATAEATAEAAPRSAAPGGPPAALTHQQAQADGSDRQPGDPTQQDPTQPGQIQPGQTQPDQTQPDQEQPDQTQAGLPPADLTAGSRAAQGPTVAALAAGPASTPDAPTSSTTPAGTPAAVAGPVPAAAPSLETAAPATPASAPTPTATAAQVVPVVLATHRRGLDGAHTMTVTLNPEEIGPVQVVVHLRAGETHVALHGTGEASRDLLRQSLPDLRRLLDDAGISAGTLDVGSRDAGDPRSPNPGPFDGLGERSQRHPDDPPRWRPRTTALYPDETAPQPGVRPAPGAPLSRRIDLHV